MVALVNKPAAPTSTAVVADIVNGLILFLGILVTQSFVDVCEEDEGKRGIGSRSAAEGQDQGMMNSTIGNDPGPAWTVNISPLT